MKTITLLAALLFLSPLASAVAQVPQVISYQGRVASQGTNFDGTGWFKFALVSGATNASAPASAAATVSFGFLVQIAVTDPGTGYTAAPAVTVTDPTGSGAVAVAQISGGRVIDITVLDAGSGYTAPTVTIAPPPGSFAVDTYWSNDGTSNAGGEPERAVAIGVSQGLFSVMLGNTNLPNMQPILPAAFNHSDVRLRIWFSDGAAGFVQLAPDQRIAAVGYAMVAAAVPDGSITAAKMADASITPAKLAPATRQELLAPAGSIILSDQQDATNLIAGGYARVPGAKVITEEWEQLSPQNSLPDQYARKIGTSFLWTGRDVIIWGGRWSDGSVYNTGARYSLASNTWSLTSTQNAATARSGNSAVWTGQEMIVWGGGDNVTNLNSGGRYNPTSDSWSPMTLSNAPAPRWGHVAVWTGTEMFVWSGGFYWSTPTNTGARYRPETDTWSEIPTADAPSARMNPFAAWTGTEMIVWGGNASGGWARSGGLYDPASNTWRPMSTNRGPQSYDSQCAWTGTDLIAFDQSGPAARYSVSENAWHPISQPPVRVVALAWTGKEVIAFADDPSYWGGRYDPLRDFWIPVSIVGAPSSDANARLIWTGAELLYWADDRLPYPYRYKPSSAPLYLYQKL